MFLSGSISNSVLGAAVNDVAFPCVLWLADGNISHCFYRASLEQLPFDDRDGRLHHSFSRNEHNNRCTQGHLKQHLTEQQDSGELVETSSITMCTVGGGEPPASTSRWF